MLKHRFGWIPDRLDPKDFKYSAFLKIPREFPYEIDLRPNCPLVYAQGETNSCVGNAVGAGVDFYYTKTGLPHLDPSRLFIYFNGRDLDGSPYEDVGCTLRNAIKGVVKLGTCSEKIWPYIIGNVLMRPFQRCYEEAIRNKVDSYYRIGYTLDDLKQCLFEGFPFTIGVRIFENFPMETSTGIIPMPQGDILGGHAMLIVGYRRIDRMFIIRNSWGSNWGDGGYGYIPFDYVLNNGWSGDFWTIRSLQSNNTAITEAPVQEGCLVAIMKLLRGVYHAT